MENYTAPDWSRSALITIDTQCDTLDGQPFEIAGTTAILPKIRSLLDAFRSSGRPIVHIVRIYQADGSNVDLCRKELVQKGARLVLAGTPGCQLAPDLLPREGMEAAGRALELAGKQTTSPSRSTGRAVRGTSTAWPELTSAALSS